MRSPTDTLSFTSWATWLTSSAESSRPSSVSTIASASTAGCSGRTGVRRPMTTPAMVAWTPDSSVASQRNSPSATYTGAYQMRMRRASHMTTAVATAVRSHGTDRSSV